jgi:Arc/MetJ-type ribon-helix-helix transcriptional regulator
MPRKKRGRPAKSPVGRIDVKLPRGLIEEIEKLVEQRIYLSKADFVRSAVREKLLAPGAVAVRAEQGK